MKHILQVWRDDGVPKTVPLMVTESHVSWALTGPMTTIFGALWLADNIGSFFEGGGAAFYHSPIQPQGEQNTCLGWTSWSNFFSDERSEVHTSELQSRLQLVCRLLLGKKSQHDETTVRNT